MQKSIGDFYFVTQNKILACKGGHVFYRGVGKSPRGVLQKNPSPASSKTLIVVTLE